MNPQAQQQLDELKKKLNQFEAQVVSTKKTLEKLEKEYLRPDYTQIDGIVGVYDGNVMTTKDGETHDVPANYAAKSKLVFGDTLKLIEEDGKSLFKQIERVDREKVEGILTKKEGEWYLLTDRGSYKVLDTAADFQGAALNSQATAFLPKGNLDAPFAALDNVEGFGKNTKPKEATEKEEAPKAAKAAKKPAEKPAKKPAKKKAPAKKPATKKPAATRAKKADKPAAVKVPPAKEIDLDDDDLV